MTDQPESSANSQGCPAPLLPLAVVVGLLIFVGTYFAYFYRHQIQAPGSYVPLAVGIGAFFCVMLWLNYVALASQSASARLIKAGGIAIAEAGAFFMLLLFLVLNTIGS